ncbi:anticodon-binding domain-containing protein [Gorgonomyces haynaldii]|nr:anticodon-binding domain-containing protein [Gorgonomyces haynaldii]
MPERPVSNTGVHKIELGTHVQVTLEHQTHQGFVHNVNSKFLILQNTVNNTIDLIWIRIESITSVKIVETKKKEIHLTSSLEQSKKRVEDAVREEMQRLGVGVPQHAQALFDALSKTLPVRWKNKTIMVMNDVAIDAPYTVEGCKLLPNGDENTLQRIKKVVQGERLKMK